uniref:Uncharacterized protein n=1 Tax=Arundo donax TaxID=35708 RepID=A0A0A9AW74_ARUDO
MLGLQYKICYKKGQENRIADALSRVSINSEQEIMSMTSVQPTWLQEVTVSYD